MVKGTSRQVIMVHPPETDLFDQAIFILNEKASESGGVTDEQILKQARQAADSYLRGKLRGGRAKESDWILPVTCFLMGAFLVGAAWAVVAVLF